MATSQLGLAELLLDRSALVLNQVGFFLVHRRH